MQKLKFFLGFALGCPLFAVNAVTSGIADDWPMRGRTIYRVSSVPTAEAPQAWDGVFGNQEGEPHISLELLEPKARKGRLKWTAAGFNQTICDPVVSNGLVWIGTADAIGDDNRDASVLACFDLETGQFLYQHISQKLDDPHQDWSGTGHTSSPFIANGKLWFCSNRLEVICLNIQPLIERTGSPQVLWTVDIKDRFHVIPSDVHLGNRATRCSIVGVDDRIFVNTTNSREFGRTPEVDGEAPSLVCLNRDTGETIWVDHSPGKNILRNQHCNPVIFRELDKNYVAIGQGDGVVRAFDCDSGKVKWTFDLNSDIDSSISDRRLDARQFRRLTESPVFDGRYLFFTPGADIESGSNKGGIYCVDPFATGDISPEILENAERKTNPNSKLVWEYKGTEDRKLSPSSAGLCVTDQLLFGVNDGIVRCFEKSSGKIHWEYDTEGWVYGTPLVVGDTLYVATDDGEIISLRASSTLEVLAKMDQFEPFYASPIFAQETLFFVSRSRVFAVGK